MLYYRLLRELFPEVTANSLQAGASANTLASGLRSKVCFQSQRDDRDDSGYCMAYTAGTYTY